MTLKEKKLENEIKSLKLSLVEKENKLKDLEGKLKLMNNEYEDFIYIVSHDLSEPLRTVDNFIKIIREEYHNPKDEELNSKDEELNSKDEELNSKDEELNTYFYFIDNAIIKMKKLIKGLSDFSKIGINQTSEKTNISETINDITKEISVLIKHKNVKIIKTILPKIECQKLEIEMLFKFLILNAIKFQNLNAQPIINIDYKEDTNYWTFCIKDNGIGIDSKNHEDIFKIFNKLHSDSAYQGIGIGLALCKKIIEIHGGEIWVKSKLNEGSEFYFSISKKLNINV